MPWTLPPPRIRPWTLAKSEDAGHYRIFDVLRGEMILPNGNPCAHTIYTLRCGNWCNVLAITPAGEAVMVWQYRHGTDALSLETPGGVVDAGESPIDGARRELLEETGYAVGRIEPLLTAFPNPAMQGNVFHAFVAWDARRVSDPKLDDAEECEVVLVPVSELAGLIDDGHVSHALCVNVLERFLRRHPQK
jgi:ADP-ribose pyrophosphatase